MEIGICRPKPPRYPATDVDAGEIARRVERFGFASLFYGEHPITPVGAQGFTVHVDGIPFFQDIIVALARASAMTTSLKLGSGVILAPHHNAVRLAKEIASLDFYSGGRITVGLGIGWSRLEAEAIGGHFDARWGRTRETVEIMKGLWTNKEFEFHGKFSSFPLVQLYPQPATKPHPPILLGSRGRAVLERVVEYGDGWLPSFVDPEDAEVGDGIVVESRRILNELAEAAGRDPESITITAIIRGGRGLADRVRRLEDVGTDAVLVSLPRVGSAAEAESALEYIAEATLFPH